MDRRRKLLAPGKVGVDPTVLQLQGHVVRQGGVDPLAQGVQLGMRGLDQGLNVAAVPQIYPKPEGAVLRLQAQVGVALLGGVPTGVEEALSFFFPLSLQGQKGFAGEVFALELLKEFSAPEDHLSGVVSEFLGGIQYGLGFLYGSIGVSGVEAEENTKRTTFSLELFPGLALQEALVGEPHRTREAAREV